jgi:hypothetical protein
MFRKSVLALAAVASLGATGLSATDALAKGKGGFKSGGWHHQHNHFGWRFNRGYRIGFYVPEVRDCVKVVNRRGVVKLVCTY